MSAYGIFQHWIDNMILVRIPVGFECDSCKFLIGFLQASDMILASRYHRHAHRPAPFKACPLQFLIGSVKESQLMESSNTRFIIGF